MKKKLLFVLVMFVCLILVGCGDKKDYKTLTCSSQEDSGRVEIKINQDKKTYSLTDGSMSMVIDLTGMGTAAKDMDWDAAFCNGSSDEIPTKACKTEVKDNSLTVLYEIDMEKYDDQLKEEAKIEEFNEKSLEDLKTSAEKSGATCTIS